MPITTEVYTVLYEDKPGGAGGRDLMARELGPEFETEAAPHAVRR